MLSQEQSRYWLEKLHSDGLQPTMQELIQFARARVGYKAPEEIVFLDAMPLNATGKVDRVKLKSLATAAG